MTKTKKKYICVIFNEPIIDSVPCLISLVKKLEQNNFFVDIFCLGNQKSPIPKSLESDNIHIYQLKSNYPNEERILGSITIYRIYNLIRLVFFVFVRVFKNKYSFVIGVEPDGIISAWILSKVTFFYSKIIYFSLELYLSDEMTKCIQSMLFKQLEKWANKKAEFTIIQDNTRANLLSNENQICIDTIRILPNSPLGKASYNKIFFLHDYFHISYEKKILLHAGAIADWAYTQELSRTSNQISSNYTTIFQSRYNLETDDYTQKLKDEVSASKVVFSLTPFPYEELDKVYCSADIGLAFYNTKILGKNCEEIGLSSGKIAHYLFHGIPVIVNNETSLAELINEHQCGIVINDFSELEKACDNICDNYFFFSNNACKCFDKMFSLDYYLSYLCTDIFNC